MHLRSRFSFSARLLQFYFAVGILILGGVWFVYSQVLLIRLSRLWTDYSTTLSAQLEQETQSSAGSAELDIIFEEVIKKIDFPVIIEDADGNPISHRNLGVEQPDPALLLRIAAGLDSQYVPIPLVVTDGDTIRRLGVIHYGISPSTRILRRVNVDLTDSVRSLTFSLILQILLLVGFVTIGIWGILVYKRREQEHIWTALAKETAHQLATPMSSMSAWLDILRAREKPEVVAEVEQDLTRMHEVLDRFSRIGLPAELVPQQAGDLLRHSVEFVQRRAPRTVSFELQVEYDPMVEIDRVLFSWLLENLLKNAVDAIGARGGSIAVRARRAGDGRSFEVEVVDSGEGVKVGKVFQAGVTTKQHGWGVGLALAKRIVESYHGGKLVLRESRPGRTVFAILLPVREVNEDREGS
jgi:signal transduction histidine kinase